MGPRFGGGGGGGGRRLSPTSATASFSTDDGQRGGDVNVRWLEEVVMLDVQGMHARLRGERAKDPRGGRFRRVARAQGRTNPRW